LIKNYNHSAIWEYGFLPSKYAPASNAAQHWLQHVGDQVIDQWQRYWTVSLVSLISGSQGRGRAFAPSDNTEQLLNWNVFHVFAYSSRRRALCFRVIRPSVPQSVVRCAL